MYADFPFYQGMKTTDQRSHQQEKDAVYRGHVVNTELTDYGNDETVFVV